MLILFARIFFVISLVLLFAQPYIPIDENAKNVKIDRNAVVYIDNSFSMQAESEKGTLLDEAKEKAKEIAAAYKSSDLFQLLTNDFEGRHQRL